MDNLIDIYKLFIKDFTPKCAGGWCYRCRKCRIACYTKEYYVPCQDTFVTQKIICPKCGARWALKIVPEEPVMQDLES